MCARSLQNVTKKRRYHIEWLFSNLRIEGFHHLKGFEQKPHLTVVLPSLGCAQSYVPAFNALICLWIGQQSSSHYWNGQFRPEFLGQAKYILESSVNHLNHWLEKLRDRSERWRHPIYMTKGIHSLFCSNPFKSSLFGLCMYNVSQRIR